jgi:hypothetical protein
VIATQITVVRTSVETAPANLVTAAIAGEAAVCGSADVA